MRPHLILIVTVFFNLVAYGQDWCPSGSRWFYAINSFETVGTLKCEYDSDTTIMGQACAKITSASVYKYKFSTDTSVYATYPSPIFSFSRNDTVFFFNHSRSTFYPTYYFGANVGDTITQMNSLGGCEVDSLVSFRVLEKGSINMNGHDLRYYVAVAFNYSSNLLYPDTLRITERLGNSRDMIPIQYCITDASPNDLRCYGDDSFPLSHLGQSQELNCEYLLTGLIEPISSDSHIYPNPTQDILYIECGLPASYEIRNSLGQTVMKGNLKFNSPLSLTNLQEGIYAIEIFQINLNKLHTKSIILY